MIENQNAGVTQKKKKYGRLKDFICFSVAAFISFSQVSPIWAAEGTRVFDEAGLFSAEEVQELETRIDEVRDSQDADLAVLTVEDAQGESAESYADDFYDSHGLGVGSDASGILLSIDMDNREIYVSTTGYAMKVLTDARVEKVLDAAYDSVDVWAYPQLFMLNAHLEMEMTAGCAGDRDHPQGQNWGCPLYRWEAHAQEGCAGGSADMRRPPIGMMGCAPIMPQDACLPLPFHMGKTFLWDSASLVRGRNCSARCARLFLI